MGKLYDLAVKTGSYTNQNGETKHRWQNIGAVIQGTDGGQYMMLAKWFNPAGVPDERGGESILISMFEPKDRQQAPQQQPQQQDFQAPSGDYTDDIPFANPYKRREYLV
jgi:hypothetical protein